MDGNSRRRKRRKRRTRLINFMLTAVVAACLGVIGVASYQLYGILKNYHDSNQLYDALKADYVSDKSGEKKADQTESEAPEEESSTEDTSWLTQHVDMAALKQTNPDVAGWIYFEDGSISYPVMYSGDDETYLHTAYDGTYAYAGALFIEGKNNGDFSDSHTIIYGHNMRNLSMFGKLKNYYQDSSYYEDHQYFQIFTENMVYRYHIFAYEEVEDSSFVYTVPYGDTEEFAEFINNLRLISSISFGDEITSADHIITLSTCTEGTGRFVVHGVRVAAAYYES